MQLNACDTQFPIWYEFDQKLCRWVFFLTIAFVLFNHEDDLKWKPQETFLGNYIKPSTIPTNVQERQTYRDYAICMCVCGHKHQNNHSKYYEAQHQNVFWIHLYLCHFHYCTALYFSITLCCNKDVCSHCYCPRLMIMYFNPPVWIPRRNLIYKLLNTL